MLAAGWGGEACEELLALRGGRPGWPDRSGGETRVEPTALACLGLLAQGQRPEAVGAAASWLARVQRPEGTLGVSAAPDGPAWPTPLALLVWENLAGFDAPRDRAARALLAQQGQHVEARSEIFGHDPTIAGWPWVADTHAWLEPTALAVLALKRHGLSAHRRVRDGLRLIRDRAIPSGGWNYGNNAVFGRVLRPQPAPTGLALLALRGEEGSEGAARRGVAYLERVLPTVRSAPSLAWGLLGLRAWGRPPAEAPAWLAEAYDRARGRPDSAPKLGLLLLAAAPRPLARLSPESPATA